MLQVPTEDPGSLALRENDEQQDNAVKPTARFSLAARVLAAAGLGLAIVAAVHAGWGGESPPLGQLPQSQLPPPPAPADTDELISLPSVKDVNAHWKLGGPHQSCNDVCSRHGERCNEVALKAVDTPGEVRYAASVANHDCKMTKPWAYDFSPSICTHKQCCMDGSCTDACTFGNNHKRSCGVKGSAHNSRLCPCTGGNVPVPTEQPLGKVIELNANSLARLYSKNEDFLIFLISPYCGICRGISRPGGPVEQAAKLLAPKGVKTYRMDTQRHGMPAGYPCRYACEYFFVHHGSRKTLYKGNHHDPRAIQRWALSVKGSR